MLLHWNCRQSNVVFFLLTVKADFFNKILKSIQVVSGLCLAGIFKFSIFNSEKPANAGAV
jgi:predicted amino acid racemase